MASALSALRVRFFFAVEEDSGQPNLKGVFDVGVSWFGERSVSVVGLTVSGTDGRGDDSLEAMERDIVV